MFKIKNVTVAFLMILSFSLANAQIKVGDNLPNIQLQNDKNAAVKLNSFKGKTVLVDFWASWCAPCRLANKNLVKMYDKYKGQNFEIVGISIDADKDKWLKAIAKDKMKHQQLIDPKGFDAKTAVLFGVEALPSTYLFDASGKLIAIDPTEAQIIAQIKKNK
ncbi:TlpA disulfide reductase family protein [Flavobacterium sp. Fl-318]|uniref:TlpA disulfide reductase family protein n=1 Tax=Flavobacterium cupriresistens TaxID=2893885 RepID=A0ABU4RIZ1_9FLAO|nr:MULTISPECIES: TlpA disulfide reductase family protein [unclassified Flavobacterium]MDX6191724.1 TlpA disulfide reductase family protein [Flavobacterium sp. Fl-318]UFH41668.1 TlpA family protein disulfide reductase [Flavobacterium sp. F-323]